MHKKSENSIWKMTEIRKWLIWMMGYTLSKSKYGFYQQSNSARVQRTVSIWLSKRRSILIFLVVHFQDFLNYQILNMDLGLKFSYHWSPVKFMRWLASMARSLQFQSKLKHFLCWKCPRGWTRPLSNHKQPKSEPKLHLTFHLMENLWWLLKQGEFIFGVFPVYYRLITEK